MFAFISSLGGCIMGDVVYTVKLPKGMTVEVNGVLVMGTGEQEEEKETA